MFTPHPSPALNALFGERPWQGADPLAARILFVGLDANYAADIESSPIFPALLDYHCDGAAFWRRHGVHHPFLLPQYRGDGLRYHRNFAHLGFTAEHAEQVCFVELLHLPTVGRNALRPSDLNASHLATLDQSIRHGSAQLVFASDGVLRLMQASQRFPWLQLARVGDGVLPLVWSDGERRLYRHLHLSNYGRFEARMRAEAEAIRALHSAQSGAPP
ncbi:MAG: hypothetical protein ACK5PG_05340 [Lysobacterales bacterium]|jgi:hypothetical protein